MTNVACARNEDATAPPLPDNMGTLAAIRFDRAGDFGRPWRFGRDIVTAVRRRFEAINSPLISRRSSLSDTQIA